MTQRIKISIPPKDRSTGPNMEVEVEVDHMANVDSMLDRAFEALKKLDAGVPQIT